MRKWVLFIFLTLILFFRFSYSQEVLLTNDNVEAAKVRSDLIREAQKSIYLSMYMLKPDRVGFMTLKELADAARRGVAVKVLLDDTYLKALPPAAIEYIVQSGVKLYNYNPFQISMPMQYTRRSHDKLWVIDHEWTIVGDRNMANEYFGLAQNPAISREAVVKDTKAAIDGVNYLEASLRLADVKEIKSKGDPELFELGKRLLESHYRKASTKTVEAAKDRYNDWKSKLAKVDHISFNSTGVGSREDPLDLDSAFLKDIQNAKTSIVIENPYIILIPEHAKALSDALRRGVRVEIYTNSKFSSDNKIVAAAWEDSRALLAREGAEIYEHPGGPIESIRQRRARPGSSRRINSAIHNLQDRVFRSRNFLHAKTATIDNYVTYIMSYNLDPRSKNLNREVSLRFESRKLASVLNRNIRTDSEKIHFIKVAAGGRLNQVAPKCSLSLRLFTRVPFVRNQL